MKRGDYTTLYFEEYNKGGGRRGGRYVGEILMSPGQRKRFRSTNLDNVKSWLDRMRMERITVNGMKAGMESLRASETLIREVQKENSHINS